MGHSHHDILVWTLLGGEGLTMMIPTQDYRDILIWKASCTTRLSTRDLYDLFRGKPYKG